MKFIKVEVTRNQGTEVYIKVPDDFTFKDVNSEIIRKAAKNTTTERDWDSFGWEETLEIQSIENVSENDGARYLYYEVKNS